MIKPFTILNTRETEHGTDVYFSVSRIEYLPDNKTRTSTLKTCFFIEKGKDVDSELFKLLSESGWI